jgi:protein disulfide-isomerase-like protein
MRSFTPYILSLLGATTAVFATRTTDTNAVSLTEETFYDFMEEHDLVLANFYAPWCRYSKMLAPKFEAAAAELKNDKIPLVKVDCTREGRLCDDFDIRAYPTLKVFRGLESHEPYDGSQQTESYVTHN